MVAQQKTFQVNKRFNFTFNNTVNYKIKAYALAAVFTSIIFYNLGNNVGSQAHLLKDSWKNELHNSIIRNKSHNLISLTLNPRGKTVTKYGQVNNLVLVFFVLEADIYIKRFVRKDKLGNGLIVFIFLECYSIRLIKTAIIRVANFERIKYYVLFVIHVQPYK